MVVWAYANLLFVRCPGLEHIEAGNVMGQGAMCLGRLPSMSTCSNFTERTGFRDGFSILAFNCPF